ncbi:MAG: hypothetical protein NZ821_10095, partial [Gloeomargarita sp. SKYB31]|nr:hypothetical protein [Gloeomargarita sp. SKYB31]
RTSLAASDVAGVALLGIKALAEQVEQEGAVVRGMWEELEALRRETAVLRARIAVVEQELGWGNWLWGRCPAVVEQGDWAAGVRAEKLASLVARGWKRCQGLAEPVTGTQWTLQKVKSSVGELQGSKGMDPAENHRGSARPVGSTASVVGQRQSASTPGKGTTWLLGGN